MTANLQTRPYTAKQAAKLVGISERTVYMVRRLQGLNRPDLEREMAAGRLSVYRALQVAEGRTPPTSYDKLVSAWNRASEADRLRLLKSVGVVLTEVPGAPAAEPR